MVGQDICLTVSIVILGNIMILKEFLYGWLTKDQGLTFKDMTLC